MPASAPPVSPSHVPTDEALLAAFAATGDEEAFARIVGRHLARVRATARRICTDPLPPLSLTPDLDAAINTPFADLDVETIFARQACHAITFQPTDR